MKEITNILQLDRSKIYNYADYLSWKLEERVELIKGKILLMSAPNRRHQEISMNLSGLFFIAFRNHPCNVYAAPFDVRLLDRHKSAKANQEIHSVVQPDLCMVCSSEKLDERGCIGAPDLIVEILSPGNSIKEMKLKRELYEENSVKEYWIIDPVHEHLIRYSLLEEGQFSSPEIILANDSFKSSAFPYLTLDLAEVFFSKPKSSPV